MMRSKIHLLLLLGFGFGALGYFSSPGLADEKPQLGVPVADPDIGPARVFYGPLVKGQEWLGKGWLADTPKYIEAGGEPIFKEGRASPLSRHLAEEQAERRRNAYIGALPGDVLGSYRPKNAQKSNGRQVLNYPDNARHGACLHPGCPW